MKLFKCPSCGTQFSIEEEKVPPKGLMGVCKKCNKKLIVFKDGKIELVEEKRVEDDPKIWHIRLKATSTLIPGGPFNLKQIREFVLEEKITQDDEAMIEGSGHFLPLKAISKMDPIFAEKVLLNRQKYGDLNHCVNHQEKEPKYFCPKCKKYFCKDCAINKPFIAGGAPRYVCKDCDIELTTLKKGGGLFSFLKKK